MTNKKDSLRAALEARHLYYGQANAPTDGSPTPSVPRMPSLDAVASKTRHQAGILESGRSKARRIGSGRERAPVRARPCSTRSTSPSARTYSGRRRPRILTRNT